MAPRPATVRSGSSDLRTAACRPATVHALPSQLCDGFDLACGSHSDSHVDVSLAGFAHIGAAAPGELTAVDTLWTWLDGLAFTEQPLEIRDGAIEVPTAPGLRIRLDRHEAPAAHELSLGRGLGAGRRGSPCRVSCRVGPLIRSVPASCAEARRLMVEWPV